MPARIENTFETLFQEMQQYPNGITSVNLSGKLYILTKDQLVRIFSAIPKV